MNSESDRLPQASPLRSKLRSLGEFARQRAKGNWQDWLAVAALVALFLFVHRFLDGLDVGGDAVTKWQFVRQWSYANDFSAAKWDHHMTRFGVNAFTWLVQKLFSTNWRSYYIAPVFMATLQVPFVYALARRFAGRLAGLFAVLCLTYLPALHTSLSQLLPDGFVGTYALIATYLLVRMVEAREQARLPLLLGLGVVAFVGYLAKETCFFFYPGLGIALLLVRRSLRDGAIFAGTLLLGLGFETGWYRLFTTYSSRLAIVRSVHFAGAEDEPLVATASGFMKMFTGLDRDWQYLLLAAAVGAVWLLVFNRSQKTQGRIVVLVGSSHLLLLGFSTQFWQRPLPRYMVPVAPFAAVCAGVAAAMLVVALARVLRLVPGSAGAKLRAAGPFVAQKSVATAGVLVVVAFAGIRTYRQQLEEPPFDGLEHGALMARLANRTYERNLPIVHANRRAKVLVAFYNVYLHDRRLARDGILPDFGVAKRRHGNSTYLVKDPSAYSRQTFAKLLEAGCVLEVRRGSKRLGMGGCADTTRYTDLPARCDALLAQLTAPAK